MGAKAPKTYDEVNQQIGRITEHLAKRAAQLSFKEDPDVPVGTQTVSPLLGHKIAVYSAGDDKRESYAINVRRGHGARSVRHIVSVDKQKGTYDTVVSLERGTSGIPGDSDYNHGDILELVHPRGPEDRLLVSSTMYGSPDGPADTRLAFDDGSKRVADPYTINLAANGLAAIRGAIASAELDQRRPQ